MGRTDGQWITGSNSAVVIRYDVITATPVRTPGFWDMTSCGFVCAFSVSNFRVAPTLTMDADLKRTAFMILVPP